MASGGYELDDDRKNELSEIGYLYTFGRLAPGVLTTRLKQAWSAPLFGSHAK